jgi:hypothetical protein
LYFLSLSDMALSIYALWSSLYSSDFIRSVYESFSVVVGALVVCAASSGVVYDTGVLFAVLSIAF